MNWFQKLWSNPNFHLVGSAVAGAASVAFPQYAGALQVVAGTLVTAGIALPEQPSQAVIQPAPVAPAPVVTLPAAAAGGSYHAVDYATLAAALLAQLAKPEQPGRS